MEIFIYLVNSRLGLILLLLISLIIKYLAQENKELADKGRRVVGVQGIVNQDNLIGIYRELDAKGKNLENIDNQDYTSWFVNTSSNSYANRVISFHETVFFQYNLMVRYRNTYFAKYIIIWLVIILSLAFSLLFGDFKLDKFIFVMLYTFIGSPLVYETIRPLLIWDKQSERVGTILDLIPKMNTINDYMYYFMEYTIVIRNFPTIPDDFFKKLQSKLNIEYKNKYSDIKIEIEQKFKN